MDVEEQLTTERLFQRLWTKAVGTADYNKGEWLSFQSRLWSVGAFESQDVVTMIGRVDRTSRKERSRALRAQAR